MKPPCRETKKVTGLPQTEALAGAQGREPRLSAEAQRPDTVQGNGVERRQEREGTGEPRDSHTAGRERKRETGRGDEDEDEEVLTEREDGPGGGREGGKCVTERKGYLEQ